MESSHTPNTVVSVPPDQSKIRKIWTVAAILGFVTAVEFVVAFSLGRGLAKTSIFVIMTVVKAAYIVGEFMHLKHETKALIWSILIPLVLIAWLIVAMLYEGAYLLTVRP